MLGEILFGASGLAVAGFTLFANWGRIKSKLSDRSEESKDTAVVCVGLEKSRFAGNCPGAGIDASNMASLLKQYASGGLTLLLNQQATAANVVSALEAAVGHDLCIFYYSGHGGRDENESKNRFGETDGRNEYLCPYDRMILDDRIWSIICKSKGRVMCIFDCCHSGTMYRAIDRKESIDMKTGPYPFTFRRFLHKYEFDRDLDLSRAKSDAMSLPDYEKSRYVEQALDRYEKAGPRLLCWSASQENEYSYGAGTGGIFTNKLIQSYGKGRTYSEVWSKLDKKMRGEPNTPIKTQFGKGFGGKIFR